MEKKDSIYLNIQTKPEVAPLLLDINEKIINDNKGEISDGYHTFNELYHHRAILFAIVCSQFKALAWKSKLHDTGDMYDGMFIVGIETPMGQATYHYDIDPYWNIFDVKELPNAPKWDGHTPNDAINRLESLIPNNKNYNYYIK